MIVERTDSEILVRLPLNSNLFESQSIIDFLRYKEIVSASKANDIEVEHLAQLVKTEIGKSYSKRSND